MKLIDKLFLYLSASLSLGIIVILIVDRCNPLMGFLESRPAFIYIVLLAISSFFISVRYFLSLSKRG